MSKQSRLSLLTFPCIANYKEHESMIWQVIIRATVKFSLLLDFRNLLTFDDLINILIRTMTISMN